VNFPGTICPHCSHPSASCICAWRAGVVAIGFALVALALSACRIPPPAEPEPEPAPDPGCGPDCPDPLPPVVTCADACANLALRRCAAAEATPGGASCIEVCENVVASGLIEWNLACRATAASCEAIDRCEAGE
jgi:hypothetical protein